MDRVTPLRRGDVWEAEFDPVRGHEQAGRRPAVIVSADIFNQGGNALVIVLPITRSSRKIRSHVPLSPPEGGCTAPSFIMCEQLRVFAVERLLRHRGRISHDTMAEVELRLRYLLELP